MPNQFSQRQERALAFVLTRLALWQHIFLPFCEIECVLAALIILLPASSGIASMDTSRYTARNWLREDGLPQNSVTATVQTRDGYIWVATYSGLARFDGVRFTAFDNNSNPELHNSRITSLFESQDRALWIGHENGEVTCYRDGRFRAVDYHAAWSGGKICGIGTDSSGDIWLLNNDGLLARLRDGLVLSPPRGAMYEVLNFACSPSGALWVERDGRVSILEHGQLQTPVFTDGRTNSLVEGIGLSLDGGLWVACNGYYQRWKDDHWVGAPVSSPWGNDPLTCLVETRNGLLAATTADRGLFIVTSDGAGEPSHFCRANNFPADWVVSLMEDREGSLWAATGGAGLVRLRHSAINRVSPPDQWQGRPVKSVTVDGGGTIWVGTEGAGVYELQQNVWKHFDFLDGLTNYYIWSVSEDKQDDLWAGTWGGGLYKKHGNIFHLAPGFDPQGPPITSIFCEGTGQLWLGTGRGLLHYDAGQTTLYAQKQAVRAVLKDRKGIVWFGMSGGGVGYLKEGVFHHFGIPDGLRSDFVQCLREDDSGAVWIGTFGGGLTRFKAGRLTTIDARQGLADNIICDIEDDGLGNFWMSSYNGLLRVGKKNLDLCADGSTNRVACDTFGISDGMPTLECSGGSQPSGFRSPDGLLWFATSRGLVKVYPREVKFNPLPPPVTVETVLVDGKVPASPSVPDGGLKIPPGRHRLEFRYTGLSFAAPEKVRFQHRLDGLDATWIDVGIERHVDYDFIPPGDYIFHVIACNNDGIWSSPGASLSFTMLPYFWQTAWFRGLEIFVLVAMVGGGSWYGTRLRMNRKLQKLERQRAVERERSRIARDIHDDLGASLTRINLLSQSAQLDIQDVPQHLMDLDQIGTTARQLTRAMDEIVWAVDPKHDTLDSLASYLAILVHEIFSDSGIRYRLDFPVRLPTWPVTAEVRHNLFLAFKEALHNVLKHSRATELNIAFNLELEIIKVVISDNGCGFDRMRSATSSHGHNGLLNMEQRLKEIGSFYEIRSETGQGTTVTFILPRKNTIR